MSETPDLTSHPWFFSGIGGSGMLPLAMILRGHGATIAGSDRSRDQGRTPEKFAWLEAQGIRLFAQDGSGVTSPDQIVVASAAVEDTVPEMVRAAELGCRRMRAHQGNQQRPRKRPHPCAKTQSMKVIGPRIAHGCPAGESEGGHGPGFSLKTRQIQASRRA